MAGWVAIAVTRGHTRGCDRHTRWGRVGVASWAWVAGCRHRDTYPLRAACPRRALWGTPLGRGSRPGPRRGLDPVGQAGTMGRWNRDDDMDEDRPRRHPDQGALSRSDRAIIHPSQTTPPGANTPVHPAPTLPNRAPTYARR